MAANRNRKRNDSGVKNDGVNILSLLRRTLSKRIVDARKDAHKVTIAVMGARRVGKSSILAQYLSHTFETKYRPTVDEYYIHMTHMEDGTLRILHLIDTAGPHEFTAMQRLWIEQSSAFVVVYSLCDPLSFHIAADLLRQIQEEKKPQKFSAVLVGNKADLTDQERVSRDAVRALSSQYGCLQMETSAKLGLNIDSIFRCLLLKAVPPQGYAAQRSQGVGDGDTVKPTLLCARNK